jgi:hypothetical protein
MLIPFFLSDSPRGGRVRTLSWSGLRRGWMRAFVLGLALTLTLALVDAATHHHNSPVETHACVVCSILIDELPGAPGLPAAVAHVVTLCYLVLVSGASVCAPRCPVALPPICGPPGSRRATT